MQDSYSTNIKIINAKVGALLIGEGQDIVIQTMCNTHTDDVEATFQQCLKLYEAGAQIIRLTVPGLKEVEAIKKIKEKLKHSKAAACPLVADIHFSSQTALAVAPFVEKVRINPGNFHREHGRAISQFKELLAVCKQHGTAVRLGLNHGSLGDYICTKYGNGPEAMAEAAMEWLELCLKEDFYNVIVSLKASNTVIMVQAYRSLRLRMQEKGIAFPLHLGVTEAGNGDSGRIKSALGISTLLSEGIGNTIRVSLTEDPLEELATASYLAERYSCKIGNSSASTSPSYPTDHRFRSSLTASHEENKIVKAKYEAPSWGRLLLDFSCDFGKRLLEKEIDKIELEGYFIDTTKQGLKIDLKSSGLGEYLCLELIQAARRKFYKPEYIACPGCGRTMFDLQKSFNIVKEKTKHLKDTVIAVMGCIVNGPGEMADADWGYIGEGKGRVSIYKKKELILKHVPESEAANKLIELIEKDHTAAVDKKAQDEKA